MSPDLVGGCLVKDRAGRLSLDELLTRLAAADSVAGVLALPVAFAAPQDLGSAAPADYPGRASLPSVRLAAYRGNGRGPGRRRAMSGRAAFSADGRLLAARHTGGNIVTVLDTASRAPVVELTVTGASPGSTSTRRRPCLLPCPCPCSRLPG